ncbi:MAG: lysophospholipid acyltransferase family protein [Verrucomicrobia bacterium]|nr:lysophospholipid acyltransferase family protein [Verrucomicrobiota bacterium]
MNILRPQNPYAFCPPKYAPWFRPILHAISALLLRRRFKIQQVTVRGDEPMARLVKQGQSVLVAPNHADHADPQLLVHVGRKNGFVFHFMAAREGFESNRLNRFVLQRSGAFSVDREGADLASVRTAMNILRECQHPLVIFPEGEIYHHHEELDSLNDGVATILLRAAEKLPAGKKSYAVPVAIRIAHDPSVAATFSPRLDKLEKRITWKPRSRVEIVERIYALGNTLLSIKEEEFIGQSRTGTIVERIQYLQRFLVDQIEKKHGITQATDPVPSRIRTLRRVIRKKLTAPDNPPPPGHAEELYDDLDRVFVAQQLYSYPGQYLRQNPTVDRIAETILKLEEDVLDQQDYPGPRHAELNFGEPIDVHEFLQAGHLDPKTGVRPMTQLLRHRIQALMNHSVRPPALFNS